MQGHEFKAGITSRESAFDPVFKAIVILITTEVMTMLLHKTIDILYNLC